MKTDLEIQKDILEEINSTPALQRAHIHVRVSNGIAELSGEVATYSLALCVMQAAKKISGVVALAPLSHIVVMPMRLEADIDIRARIAAVFRWDNRLSAEQIKAEVSGGHVALFGQVIWAATRTIAEKAIENLAGIRSVTNHISVRSITDGTLLQKKISAALQRNAIVDADSITVVTHGASVTLTGMVKSFAEKEEAIAAAYATTGVAQVEDRLEINYPEYFLEP